MMMMKPINWDKHIINSVTAKANSTLGFVRRNIKISNPVVKERAYKTLVRPVLEYALRLLNRFFFHNRYPFSHNRFVTGYPL